MSERNLEGWMPVAEHLPPVGERVGVCHAEASAFYDTTGEVDADGNWSCCNGFVYPIGRQAVLSFNPTHWRAQAPVAA